MNALLKKLVFLLLLFAVCSSTAIANTPTPLAFFWLKNRVVSEMNHPVTIVDAHFDGAFDEAFSQPANCTMNNTGYPKTGNELQFYCKIEDKDKMFGHMSVTVDDNGQIEMLPCTYADPSLPSFMVWFKSMPINANIGALMYINNKLQCVITTF